MSIGPSSSSNFEPPLLISNKNVDELNQVSNNLISALETPISTKTDVEGLRNSLQKVDSLCSKLLSQDLDSNDPIDASALNKFKESLNQFTKGVKNLELTDKNLEVGSLLSRLDDLRSLMDDTVEWQSTLREYRPKLVKLHELQNTLNVPNIKAYMDSLSIISQMINLYSNQPLKSDICKLKLINEINQTFQQLTKTFGSLEIKPEFKEMVDKIISQLNRSIKQRSEKFLAENSGDVHKIKESMESTKLKNSIQFQELITDASTSVLHTGWIEAIKSNDLALISLYLESGVDVNYLNSDGLTAMHIAALSGNVELINKLHQSGGNVNFQNKTGTTPMHLAARFGKVDAIYLFHKLGARIDEYTECGTPLFHAIALQQIEAIEALHKLGADLNTKNKISGATCLMFAAKENMLKMVKTLLKLGADKSLRDKHGDTALTLAGYQGNIPVVAALLGPSSSQHLDNYKIVANLPGQSSLLLLAKACLESGKHLYEPQYLALKLLGHSWKIVAPSKVEDTQFRAGESSHSPIWARFMMEGFTEFDNKFRNELRVEENSMIDIFLSSIINKGSPKLIRGAIERNEPVNLFNGFEGHTVSVFFYAGYLIIPNKGAASRKPIEVYKINPDKLTKEVLQSFLSIQGGNEDAFKLWLQNFPKVLDAQSDEVCKLVENGYPSDKLGKYQLTGNCSWESPEIAVYGLLALQRTLEASKPDKKQASLQARETFLHWRSFMLLHAIEECFKIYSLKEMAATEINPMLNEIFLASEKTDWSAFGTEMEEHAASLEKRYIGMLSESSKQVYLNAKKMQQINWLVTLALGNQGIKST